MNTEYLHELAHAPNFLPLLHTTLHSVPSVNQQAPLQLLPVQELQGVRAAAAALSGLFLGPEGSREAAVAGSAHTPGSHSRRELRGGGGSSGSGEARFNPALPP